MFLYLLITYICYKEYFFVKFNEVLLEIKSESDG